MFYSYIQQHDDHDCDKFVHFLTFKSNFGGNNYIFYEEMIEKFIRKDFLTR